MNNMMKIEFSALPENEKFARVVISAFFSRLNPTIEELEDVKTAVSEAVTNAIIHGYENDPNRLVCLYARIKDDRTLYIEVVDQGIGIADIEQARRPFYTSKPELERSGMGFSVMESFMDEVEVLSQPGSGTTIKMIKRLS